MTVIQRTRIKFFMVMAAIVFIILFVFCASILISTYVKNTATGNAVLQKMLSDYELSNRPFFPSEGIDGNDGRPPNERINVMRGFMVRLDGDFAVLETYRNESVYTNAEIAAYIAQIRVKGTTDGEVGSIKFLIVEINGDKILAALDTKLETDMFNELLITVLLAGGGGMVVILIVVWLLSFWIIRPAADAFTKQKRFISEAGHELKTPLTVISASLDLLEKNAGKGVDEKRIQSIKDQVGKMSVMTANLLTLSKMDEEEHTVKAEFDLSQAVLTEGLAFESVAFENGKKLSCQTDSPIWYRGDADAARRAVAILCDNAIRHSGEHAEITVRLKKQAARVVLTVSNTESALSDEELPFLFERFYRGSESRASHNGAGLGLAILKTLADKNGWKTSVVAQNNTVTFSIVF